MTDSKAPKIVGVILSPADFQKAVRMRRPPDLFELRLDFLARHLPDVEKAIARLPAPLIITARHPREGGSNQLSARKRHVLLRRFLPHASYVDIELRSAGKFVAVLAEARAKGVGTIISFHDFDETPSRPRLDEIARATRSLGADLLKIATRTDTQAQFSRLLEFFLETSVQLPIAAMGVGRLGRTARRALLKQGSILNYVHLGRTRIGGQPSLSQIRRWMAACENV
ncbi:MAG: type I 3-dehydroquinate dehydratase [Chthoniobacterales bacterium]